VRITVLIPRRVIGCFPAVENAELNIEERWMNNSRGLTLFELIIVVSIIAILMALALPAYY